MTHRTTNDARPRTAACAPATAPGGFSLVEVLIAVIVLGLGALSLAAVFAGAARQQQASAELTRATALTGAAEARLRSNFGALQPPGALPTQYQHGRWYPMTSEDTDSAIARYTLTSRPFIGPGINTSGWAFVVDDIDGHQFFVPSGNPQQTPPYPAEGGVADVNNFAQYANLVGSSFQLPHRRIVPQSFNLNFLTNSNQVGNWYAPPGVGQNYHVHETVAVPPGVTTPDVLQLTLTGPGVPGANWVRFNFAHSPGEVAGIVDWRCPPPPGPPAVVWIYEVNVEPYQWLNDRLVSLNDRLVYEDDDSFPADRRPVMGYTVLFRTISDGAAAQMTVFPYTLAPLAVPQVSPSEFVFAPPESLQNYNNEDAILREVPLVIGYDPETGQFFAEIEPGFNEADFVWALAPGQWLLMNSANGVGSGAADDPGADEAVKVLTQRRNPDNGAVRAILSDSPRINNSTPVQDLTSVPATAMDSIYVWAMPPIVESMTPDATQWQVRPIEPRTFQIVLR